MPSGKPPRRFRDMTRKQWRRVGLGVVEKSRKLDITDGAAALAYYAFLSLFPAMIVGVALLALLGDYPETYNSIIRTLREAAPGTAVDTIDSALRDVLQNRGSARGLLSFGLLAALYTASSGVAAAIRVLERIDPAANSRRFVRGYAARLGLTIAVLTLVFVAFNALLLAGPIFAWIADAAGLDPSTQTVISLLRWPLGLGALMAAILLVYWLGPGAERRHIRHHVPGAVLATALGVVASLGFSAYVANFSSYDATYGALGTAIVLMVWLYVMNLALLAGAVANVELTKVRTRR